MAVTIFLLSPKLIVYVLYESFMGFYVFEVYLYDYEFI